MYAAAVIAGAGMVFSLVVAYLLGNESPALHWLLCLGLGLECCVLFLEVKRARASLMQPFDAFHTL